MHKISRCAGATCARFLVAVDRRHTVSVWRMPRRFSDAAAAAGPADLGGSDGGGDSDDDPMPLSRDQPVMHAQYFNQSLSSGLPLLSASAFVAVAFLSGGRQLLFHHSQENCVKLWRTEWAEQSAERSAAGGPPSPSPLATVPLATPVLFHCDRLTSSAQASLSHFFTVK